ncbi:MAG: NosD domain-containing protein [Candidatus Bathyarchaeota archaeon]|jgi:parallel beta-helix repeat protein
MKKLFALTMFLLLFTNILTGAFVIIPCSIATEASPEFLDANGTYFQLPDFDFSIETTEIVHIMLRARTSDMISYYIENASLASSSEITLGNLSPLSTYYMYEDSYVNENVFTTDESGSYTYVQDLSQLHHVFIQPRSSTVYIGTSTTLTSDIYDTVVITADDVVLDLNGHSIIGSGGWMAWFGVDIYFKNNVTVKNGCIENHLLGIYLGNGRDNVIRNNTITGNWWSGIEVSTAHYSTICENNFTSNGWGIDIGWKSTGNNLYHNNFISDPVYLLDTYPNTWDNDYPSAGNYWSDYSGEDDCCGSNQDKPGSDGVGDIPYDLGINNDDFYPLMNPWYPKEIGVKLAGADYSITMLSNTVIDQVTSTKNTLKFSSSGTTGETGYLNIIFPMMNTTGLKVSVDGEKLTSPALVINDNDTHYYIYFEFPLSSHDIEILFSPIAATIDIDPDTLNLKSEGQWITTYIELDETHNSSETDISTILTNGTIPAEVSPNTIGDYDNDNITDLMVKFSRSEIMQLILGSLDPLEMENNRMYATLKVTGELTDGTPFEGHTNIRVISPHNLIRPIF